MKKVLLVVAIILLIPSLARANELINSDFETGFVTPWTQIGYHTAEVNGTAARSGTKGLEIGMEGPPVQGDGWGGYYQNFAASPGEVFGLNAWVNTTALSSDPVSNASLQIAFFDVSAPTFAETPIGAVNTPSLSAGADWTQLSLTSPAAPAGTKAVRYVLAVWGNPGSEFPATGSAYFDDVSGDIIPEPSSLLLLGSGIIGMLSASRKKKRA